MIDQGYRPENVARLFAIYLGHAEACMREIPEHYAPSVLAAGPRANADRTFDVIRGRGVHGLMIDKSPSWKRTCRTLGIRHTYKALEAFLRTDHATITDGDRAQARDASERG